MNVAPPARLLAIAIVLTLSGCPDDAHIVGGSSGSSGGEDAGESAEIPGTDAGWAAQVDGGLTAELDASLNAGEGDAAADADAPDVDAANGDAGHGDAGAYDAGGHDAASADTGTSEGIDGSAADASAEDASTEDASATDSGPQEPAMCGKVLCDCTFKGIPLFGKVKVVTNFFATFKVKKDSSFPDLNVNQTQFATSCGKWYFVDNFEDFSVIWDDNFPDFEITYSNFPGLTHSAP